MKTTTLYSSFVAALIGVASLPALAADLADGTVISASNLDQVKDATFEGHTIGSMLTEKMEWRIRNSGWKITLAKSKKIPLDPRWVKASKANEGKTKIDDANCKVDGWEAGEPFPTIDMNDPQAAKKVIWNLSIGPLLGDVSSAQNFTQILVDGKSGIHAELVAEFTRFSMKGRLAGGPSVIGSDDESMRQLLFFKSPSEVKGIGTYTVMYDSAKVPDVWAYVPAVRRTRRLSGGAWMDPVGSSDQLQDDLDGFNARPCWYPGYKMLGKRWVLAPANGRQDIWNQKASATAEKYPTLEQSAPFWNLNDSFEPREVYMIEVETPSQHPYSKKVIYIDTEYPRVHYAEAYNRKGEFWKFIEMHSYINQKDGDIRTISADVIDFQRNHATISLIDAASWRTNYDAKPSDVSLTKLESAGR